VREAMRRQRGEGKEKTETGRQGRRGQREGGKRLQAGRESYKDRETTERQRQRE